MIIEMVLRTNHLSENTTSPNISQLSAQRSNGDIYAGKTGSSALMYKEKRNQFLKESKSTIGCPFYLDFDFFMMFSCLFLLELNSKNGNSSDETTASPKMIHSRCVETMIEIRISSQCRGHKKRKQKKRKPISPAETYVMHRETLLVVFGGQNEAGAWLRRQAGQNGARLLALIGHLGRGEVHTSPGAELRLVDQRLLHFAVRQQTNDLNRVRTVQLEEVGIRQIVVVQLDVLGRA